jgi:putative redox protein
MPGVFAPLVTQKRILKMAQVEVKAKVGDGFRQEISSATHAFAADAPKEFGGGDSAPNPHELLLGSLGACTAITVQMYAKRKGWDLKGISVNVQEETVDEDGQKQSQITREIELTGDLTDEQVENLKAIADKCPIHKILNGPKKITTAIKRG